MRRHDPLFPFCLFAVALLTGSAGAKTHRTYYTEDMLGKALKKIATKDWAKSQAAAAEAQSKWLVQMSDEDLWHFIPPAAQMRALNANFGADCPIHGAVIHRQGGHYPWIMSRDKPFKVECPVGHEVYPTNEFEPWWIKGKPPVTPENSSPTEKYVDNGGGWVNEKGVRYWFVPHYLFWQRWQRDVLPGVQSLAQAYLLTGKPLYGHKCAVMLARLAEQYPQMNYLKQAYHHAYPTGVRGKILDYIWETGVVSNLATAYDAVFPATDLTADPELASFVRNRGISDLRGSIEKNILSEMIDCLMNNTIRGNMGMPQQAMATLALVLDNNDPTKGHTTQELVDWVLKTEPGKTTGDTEDLFYNGFYRDGHGGESSPGYSSGWCVNFYQVAEKLERLGVDLWKRPKMKKMADILLDMTTAGKFSPAIGDAGSINGAGRLWSEYMMRQAWTHYRDPIYAKALKQLGGGRETLWEDSLEEEIDAVVKKEGDQIVLPSRNLGGYGLAVLESGEPPNQRAVSMYYGSAAGGHGHRDRLSTEAWFYGKPVLPEHGYPAHWLPKCAYWTTNTLSHYAVVVNRKWQETMYAGHLNYLADSPVARVMDASAEVAYPNDASLYRHTVAMIDLSPTDSYLFDLWRVAGGTQHDWSFHGIPFADFTVNGLDLTPVQTKGTLAGNDVAFGDNGKPDAAAGFQYLFNVQKAYATKPFTAMWKSTRDDTALNMTLVTQASEIIVADCEPELQPGAPETVKYVIARNLSGTPPFQAGETKDGLDSAFAAVVEPLRAERKIRSASPLTPRTPTRGFVGVRVERAGATDFLLSNRDSRTA
ncbi:MAG: heparinase II/III family protein, partial [Armatimonadetes bacterium]|nr:heparinase II/III family protein [Armatimonadota bacterium]